ncbi:uncharacterized protein PFL1_01089 [Pseudozyma flocculosa PF-1]|uniref:uncharacterized protein n=1 Tax=Pseudozyma flocculosa PF-1 TaxID=1277687 RepID=UPI0004561A5A|nr:uncharacterized protein PFL1_01089 [Pseudozyma flocculosa PF-1]EPQ31757.1 hypothetical protein PFL1_01089 [Pseudozyma flocculosa PF-1]
MHGFHASRLAGRQGWCPSSCQQASRRLAGWLVGGVDIRARFAGCWCSTISLMCRPPPSPTAVPSMFLARWLAGWLAGWQAGSVGHDQTTHANQRRRRTQGLATSTGVAWLVLHGGTRGAAGSREHARRPPAWQGDNAVPSA